MVEENWRKVVDPDFEDFYEVSDEGRVRRISTGRILKVSNHPKGYRSIMLSGRGQRKNFLVHKLVLESFVGSCPEGHESRHLDGNRANNCLPNLAWGTSSENEGDKVRHGTVTRGERNGQATLSAEQVYGVVRRCGAGESQRAVASAYGISQSQVSRIVTGRRWSHLEATITAS